jgi:hypothetical protein
MNGISDYFGLDEVKLHRRPVRFGPDTEAI